jgi:DNA polymerase III epsilon subunit-like protein
VPPVLKEPLVRIHEVGGDRYEVSDIDIRGLSRLRIFVFDLEATGLDTTRERITQIAGLPLERGLILAAKGFSQLVDPGADVPIPAEVAELTGITRERLAGAPRFPEAWAACTAAARGCDLWIGQSAFEFDVPLLRAEFARHGLPPALPPLLDSVVLATALLGEPEGRWSTTALLQRFHVNTEGLRRHDALDDVQILARILIPLLEMLREERADHLFIPPEKRLSIKRHPSR